MDAKLFFGSKKWKCQNRYDLFRGEFLAFKCFPCILFPKDHSLEIPVSNATISVQMGQEMFFFVPLSERNIPTDMRQK
jgi:hypothetical protein